MTLKKLLHTGNSIKLRRDGLRLFIAWYQILQENATAECHALFARLLNGDEAGTPGATDARDSLMGSALVRPVEVSAIVLPLSSDPTVETGGTARYLLDALLAYAASENCHVRWPSRKMQSDAFRFMLERFHMHYLVLLFPDLAFRYSIYSAEEDEQDQEEQEELQLSRIVRCCPSPAYEESPLVPCDCLGRPLLAPLADELCAQQEVVIRWFSALLHHTPAAASASAVQTAADSVAADSQQHSRAVSKEDMLSTQPGNTETLQHFGVIPMASGPASNPSSNANTLDAPDGGPNAGNSKQPLFCEDMVAQAQSTNPDALELMRDVLLRDRDAINTLLQVLRQASCRSFSQLSHFRVVASVAVNRVFSTL